MPVLVPRSLSGGMYASGAADHDRQVRSHSHKQSRFGGGEGVDEIHLVGVCVKVDSLVIKPTQPRLQDLQPVTVCCTGRLRLNPVPRRGLTSAELLGNHCPAQPACPSTSEDPPPPTFAARSPGDVGVHIRTPGPFPEISFLARESSSRIKAPIKMTFKTKSVGQICSDTRPSVTTAHCVLKHCFNLC